MTSISWGAAVIAFIPAFVNAWWGRALVRLKEDAAIGERLLVHRRRMLRLTIIAIVVLAVGMPHTLIWSLPLLLISRAIASFPSRRALFGETWNLAEYLAVLLRLCVAFFGFWILLAASPSLTSRDRPLIGIVIFIILVSWNQWYRWFVLRLTRAQPLDSDALKTRFARVVERSTAPAPTVWRAGPAGANYANALALPSLRHPSVLISETLLARLSEEEITAIFAHEIAHLEQYNRSRLLRESIIVLALIVTGVFLIPFLQGALPREVVPIQALWAVFILVYQALKARHAQANERACDLRAVELFGNAETLISALIKLHAIGRMPRRWEPEMEALASHPSLARRIQAMRKTASQSSGPQLCEIFRAVENGVIVAFDSSGLRQFRGVPPAGADTMEALQSAADSFTYTRFGEVTELRVAAKGNSDPELVIADSKGGRLALRMQSEDLLRLQRTLDNVDIFLAPAPKSLFVTRSVASIAASVAAVAALTGAQLWSITFVALASAFRPTRQLITTVAAVSALSLILIFARGTLGQAPWLVSFAGILPLIAAAIWIGFRPRNKEFIAPEHLSRWILWLFGVAATVSICVPLLLAYTSLLSCSMTLSRTVACVVFPFTMASLLVRERKAGLRWLALLFGIAGCASIALGTQWFRERIIRDPLLATFPEFSVTDAPAEEIARFAVEPSSSDIRLSPRGTRVAVRYGASEDEGPYFYAVYEKNGVRRRALEAMDLRFIDESHMLVLSTSPSGLVLDLVAEGDAPVSVWRSEPGLNLSARLAVAPETGEWRILGQARDGKLMRFQGMVGTDAVKKMEWAMPEPAETWTYEGTSGSGPVSIWIHRRYKTSRSSPIATLSSIFSDEYPEEATLFLGREAGASLVTRSEARVRCLDPPAREDKAICFAYYQGTTNVFALDPSHGVPKGLGKFAGSLWDGTVGDSGTVVFSLDGTPAILDIGKRRLFRISYPDEVVSFSAASRAGMIGILATVQDRSVAVILRPDESISR